MEPTQRGGGNKEGEERSEKNREIEYHGAAIYRSFFDYRNVFVLYYDFEVQGCQSVLVNTFFSAINTFIQFDTIKALLKLIGSEMTHTEVLSEACIHQVNNGVRPSLCVIYL